MTALGDRSLTIVLPAFNEGAGIEATIAACRNSAADLVGSGRLRRVDIVSVDDGSTDDTADVLRRLAVDGTDLTVLHHDANRGLGGALRTGFAAASTDLVFYTDADLPVDLGAIGIALDLLTDDVDAVSAFRRSRRGEGPRRFVYSLAYNGLCRAVLGLRVRDVNFAAKLFRTDQLRELDLQSEGSFIDAEVIARLERAGHRIVQFPADYRPRSRGVSTLSSTGVIVTIAREMYRIAPSVRGTGTAPDRNDPR